jgi:EAL domain-containing protein (putative c-di-GMP-specific phosphodiesterase class I)
MSPSDAELLAGLPGAGARGEWELYYQPKVAARTRRIESVEALLRWEHPTMGTLPPERFVLVAETSTLLGELTRWVIGEALDAQVRWRDVPLTLPVAVNLSAQLVGDLDLLGWIGLQLQVRGLGPEVLTVEITETADMGAPDLAAPFLVALRAYGIRVSVDDFGTGYTSLNALALLPLDELKIDQAFIRRSATSSADEAVIRSVRELGHRLGLKVVAEGVEDEATARRLTDLGVDVLQGFWFSPPLREEALLPFVAAERRAERQASGQLDI